MGSGVMVIRHPKVRATRASKGDGPGASGPPSLRRFSHLCQHPARLYIEAMTIEDLEKAVATLPPEQFAQFRAWFEQFDAARFDQKIERDAKEGKLDRLAEQALDDWRAGRTSEL